jgi:hypothetical protein
MRKHVITLIIGLTSILVAPLLADQQAKVIAVPVATSLRPDEKLTLDVYLCNTGRTPVRVPSFDLVAVSSSTVSGAIEGMSDLQR